MTYRTALITGASSGLGRGLATWFVKRGVTVYAAARRLELLQALQRELGAGLVPVALDVADADATHARVAALDREAGGLDLVLANAGIGDGQSAGRATWSHTHQVLKVNVVGAVATLAGALPAMVERGRGHLVAMSSLASLVPLPRSASYCASKAFLNLWLDAVRLDVGHHGVAVTCLQPGFVKSELTAKYRPGSLPFLLETDDAVERMGQAILRRDAVFAFPWPMAALVHAGAALPRPVLARAVRKMRA